MAGKNKPNIVLIMVDDMGFSDIGCYGSEISTPNIDRLAAEGVRFTHAYNCARCCPTRASILTGLYAHQAGIGQMVGDHGVPSYQGYLRKDAVTIAEALGDAGYRTLMSGKWHVGGHYSSRKPETWRPGAEDHPTPLDRGFERFYGTLCGANSYFNPHTLMQQREFIEPEGDDYYYTDAISDNAAAMIEEFADEPDPFFLYVAYTAPHWPLHAKPEDIAKYRGKYRDGWTKLRNQRFERLKEAGIIDEKWRLSPQHEKSPDWDSLSEEDKDWEDARMAVYAAQIDCMDQGVGRIMSKLREKGIEDDTLVMFLSDNGGCAEFLAEDGWIENCLWPTRDGQPVQCGNARDRMPGPADTFMSYDLPWANASNSPFRLFKCWVHEGGISTPLVVRGPGVQKAGELAHDLCHVIDIMPTCLEAAGAEYPTDYRGNSIQPVEGVSLMPALSGSAVKRDEPIFFEHLCHSAVRDGKWKLVCREPRQWELYDMDVDRTELNDLAAEHPEKVQELVAQYDAWAERCGVLSREELRKLEQKYD